MKKVLLMMLGITILIGTIPVQAAQPGSKVPVQKMSPCYSGNASWELILDDPDHAVLQKSIAVASDGRFYFGTSGRKTNEWEPSAQGKVYSISPEGKKNWSLTIDSPVDGKIFVANDGTLYFTTYSKITQKNTPTGTEMTVVRKPDIYSIDQNGKINWKKEADSNIAPTILPDINSHIYFLDLDNKLYTTDSNGSREAENKLEETIDENISSQGVPPAKRRFTTLRNYEYKNSRFSPR
ncbi:hypothetical protein [Brevibacillus centrosporus]|uniref:hypothetical protein n=1 Tax=Brevibacillus TaxID=55080 RepID=UPI003988065A